MSILDTLRRNLVNEEEWPKDSFWASDCEKDRFDLFHRFKGTKPTNPISPEKAVVFGAGKAFELAIVDRLTRLGIVQKPEGEGQDRVEMDREGVKITGRMDSIVIDNGEAKVLEIKSFYGEPQAMDLRAGKPRSSYLKQLAIYMDAMEMPNGILLYMDRGTGEMFQFNLRRGDGLVFSCDAFNSDGKTVHTFFDLAVDYKRFAQIWRENIVPGVEPESDYRYKYLIDTIDWAKVPKSKITEARMGRVVLGDWQAKYSPYKDLIVDREAKMMGKTFDGYIGYSAEEIEKIKELTKGFSSKK
jgi:hypothetical protein